jgi:hypothetical protein
MPLPQNAKKSFQGSIVLGKGFVLTIEEAERLISKDPRNKDVLFPYLNGDDLNNDPEQKPSRWVINFFDWTEEKARTYPDCFEILERRVKPERQRWALDKDGNEIIGTYALRKPLPQKWWIYGEKRPALYDTISKLDQVIAIPNQACKYVAFQFSTSRMVFSNALAIFCSPSYYFFAVLSSSFHVEWAWKYASRMKFDMRYTPTDVFENFPFPQSNDENLNDKIEKIGNQFNTLRKQLLLDMNLGLTKFYNLFHNNILVPFEKNAVQDESQKIEQQYIKRINELRNLQIELDNVILESYGWIDLNLSHGFYEQNYLPEHDRIRFTIHPNSRTEVLKRLLILNNSQNEKFQSEISNSKPQKVKQSKIISNNDSLLF